MTNSQLIVILHEIIKAITIHEPAEWQKGENVFDEQFIATIDAIETELCGRINEITIYQIHEICNVLARLQELLHEDT